MKRHSRAQKQDNSTDQKGNRILECSGLSVLEAGVGARDLQWVTGTKNVALMGDWSSAHCWNPEILG